MLINIISRCNYASNTNYCNWCYLCFQKGLEEHRAKDLSSFFGGWGVGSWGFVQKTKAKLPGGKPNKPPWEQGLSRQGVPADA